MKTWRTQMGVTSPAMVFRVNTGAGARVVRMSCTMRNANCAAHAAIIS